MQPRCKFSLGQECGVGILRGVSSEMPQVKQALPAYLPLHRITVPHECT